MLTSIGFRPVSAALLSLVVLAGCGGEPDKPAPAKPDPKPAPVADVDETADDEDAGPGDLASLPKGGARGAIRYGGAIAGGVPIDMAADTFCVDQHPDGVKTNALIVNGDALVNAFVWIDHDFDDLEFEVPDEPVILDQVDCLYEPRVAGAMLDQKVYARNSDKTLHNVHTKPKINREINVAMPEGAKDRQIRFKRAEVIVEFVCDVHPWMKAWVGVVDHPFFAVTGDDGSWSFEGVPAGTYTVKAWHEVAGETEFEVTIAADDTVTVDDVTLSAG